MWFKKKSVLQSEHHYDTEKSADGSTDMRTTWKDYFNVSSSFNSGLPAAADAGNYFYLPALGSYSFGQLYNVGIYGPYWSSSAYSGISNHAYNLTIGSDGISINYSYRNAGFSVGGFE